MKGRLVEVGLWPGWRCECGGYRSPSSAGIAEFHARSLLA